MGLWLVAESGVPDLYVLASDEVKGGGETRYTRSLSDVMARGGLRPAIDRVAGSVVVSWVVAAELRSCKEAARRV